MTELPYRRNVGAALFNAAGLVLIGRRAGLTPDAPSAWQMPQGGIDEGEDPRTAVFRELLEEIGTANAEIIGEHPDWLTYDIPPASKPQSFKGRYKGQIQKWFALRFLGTDAEIALDRHEHPEFLDWRWAALAELPALAVPFKRAVYEAVVAEFSPFAARP
jgi:putative (di)nucleoside polyphosphate hydrolase